MACRSRLLTLTTSFIPSVATRVPPPVSGRALLFKVLPRDLEAISAIPSARFGPVFSLSRTLMQNMKPIGRKLLAKGFLGLSTIVAVTYQQLNLTYAADDYPLHYGESDGFSKDDLHRFWSLARKFQLPALLLVNVLLGWRHPLTLAINTLLLLFCTRPSPLSVYVFVEQMRQWDMQHNPSLSKSKMRQWDMQHNPSLSKSKLFYTKKVEVDDYKIFCLAKVEFHAAKLELLGILGGWWVLRTFKTC